MLYQTATSSCCRRNYKPISFFASIHRFHAVEPSQVSVSRMRIPHAKQTLCERSSAHTFPAMGFRVLALQEEGTHKRNVVAGIVRSVDRTTGGDRR